MRFVDEASLYVKAGDGGRGCVSFRREPYVPKGGPNGGDGGKGGDVLIVGQKNLISLLDFKYKRIYQAENGQTGSGNNKTGRNGKDIYIRVPLGTIVYDASGGEILADIVEDGQTYVAANGGRGGRGNARFVSSVNRAPLQFDEGEKGEERSLRLELKLLARIGIIGLPNAGKSTLLSRLTSATPEIGSYPFTTLTPSLGVLCEEDQSIVIADIPGIIGGASKGKGLGLKFLRHVERTAMLLWVIDGASPSVTEDYETLHYELSEYKRDLTERERIVVLNKTDLITPRQVRERETMLRARGGDVVAVSAATGSGIDRLKERIKAKNARKNNG